MRADASESILVNGEYLIDLPQDILSRLLNIEYSNTDEQICTLGLATTVALVVPRFEGPRFRIFRVSTLVLTGLSGFAPLIHGLKLFGLAQMIKQSGMPYYLLEGLLFILGAIFYATRAPEIARPGRFDIWGCSHQIFHLLVVAAASVHAVGLLRAFDYNHRERNCGM